MKVLGLMSGTSMDGLDCCYVDIIITKSMILNYQIIDFQLFEYDDDLRKIIKNILDSKNNFDIQKVHNEIGFFLLECSKKILGHQKIDLISMHGQTISHHNGVSTKQIGNPKYLHNFFKVPVAYDFRSKDIENGGTGAPLIPFLDWMLYKDKNVDTITLNLGGISNITYIPKSCKRNNVIGFDAGPGMCLIDEYVKFIWGKNLDYNAEYSSKGKVNYNLLNNLFKNDFIIQKPPKSTGRNSFSQQHLMKLISLEKKISYYDVARTLVNFTAKVIRINIEMFIDFTENCQLIISGGGANHPLLIKDIKRNIKLKKITLLNKGILNNDSKEAFLMAIMGYTCYHKIPNNMTKVTGAKKTTVYGKFYE